MDVERKRELMMLYNETASVYDRRYEGIQKHKHRWILRYLPRRMGSVLDVGCGSGLLLELLRPLSARLVGIDFSERMIRLARERVPEARLVLADAESLPFTDGSFDVVVSATVIQNAPSPERVLNEIARVLRKGGLAVLTSLKRKHTHITLRNLATSAQLRVKDSGNIPDSEDVFCVCTK